MTLKARITEDMKNAMRAKEATRLSTIRLLLAAMKQREVDERIELADADVVAIIDKMIKQRRESIVQFDAGNRPDLAAVERAEITLLQAYMPQPLSETEIDALIASAVANAAQGGAVGMAAMGKVMAAIRPQLAGRANMSLVSAKVKSRLNG
ncbi:MAG TPA: GatB/YqeY domain-containing protein [Casimicrobiaceae bacterium]|nr:GatB/YqeY domain-containing protein [Casimicrobiaceae bacterium]